MLRSKDNKPVITLQIRDRTLSTNKSASSKDPSFISIFNRRMENIKRERSKEENIKKANSSKCKSKM